MTHHPAFPSIESIVMHRLFGPERQPGYAYSETIPPADATCEASDEWAVFMDPENERGDYVEALFTVATGYDSTMRDLGHGRFCDVEYSYEIHHLIGFTVESIDYRRFVDREEIERIIGEGRVGDIEDMMDEKANWA